MPTVQSVNHSSRDQSLRLLTLAVFVAVVWFRLPHIMQHGRFWAEEGRLYFTNAWTLPWWQALLRPEVGYLSLLSNVAGLIARYAVPLEAAPHVTTAIALFIQCLPAFMLLAARDTWLRPRLALCAGLLILATPPVSGEVWLNTANSQFHLAVAAALCLALAPPVAIGRRIMCGALFLAPLCSPVTMALAPLFALRAVLDRSAFRAAQTICITAGTAVQAFIFLDRVPGRGHLAGPTILITIFAVKNLAIPLLGPDLASRFAASWQQDVLSGVRPAAALVASVLASALAVLGLWVSRLAAAFWLFFSGAVIAVVSYYGGLDSGPGLITVIGGNRYAFAPDMLLELGVLSLAATQSRFVSRIARVVVVWLLVIGAVYAVRPQDRDFADGPRWKAEVAKWRADPTRPIAIWPTGWVIYLPGHRRL